MEDDKYASDGWKVLEDKQTVKQVKRLLAPIVRLLALNRAIRACGVGSRVRSSTGSPRPNW